MRQEKLDYNTSLYMVAVGLAGWLAPGGGYFILGQKKRAAIIFVTLSITFVLGLYVGSIGVIDPVAARNWYFAQLLFSPAVAVLGRISSAGTFVVYGKPNEIGQIYTSIAGLLNLLCVVRSVHAAGGGEQA